VLASLLLTFAASIGAWTGKHEGWALPHISFDRRREPWRIRAQELRAVLARAPAVDGAGTQVGREKPAALMAALGPQE